MAEMKDKLVPFLQRVIILDTDSPNTSSQT